jgi:uncharacterized protein YoxC
MNETILLLLVMIVALVSGFLISALLEIRKAAKELGRFIETAEGSITPAAAELNGTMKSLKTAAEEISEVARDVQKFSSAVEEVSENVKKINYLLSTVPAMVAGVAAGIKSVVEYYARPRGESAEEENRNKEP